MRPRLSWRRAVLAACAVALAALVPAGAEPGGAAKPEPEVAEVTVSADRLTMTVDGTLGEGTARRVRQTLRAHPTIRLVILVSEGGYVDEAEQIGDLVAAAGLSTYVAEFCVSACTLAYVRGQERLAAPDAQLGFHAPYDPDAAGGLGEVSSEQERQSYLAAGIEPGFVAEALRVPASDIWFPEPDRLTGARVVSAFVPEAELGPRLAALPEPRRHATAE